MKLSDKERKVFELLSIIKGETTMHITIRDVCQETNSEKLFRQLIFEIKDRARDNAKMMKEILGEETFNTIMNL